MRRQGDVALSRYLPMSPQSLVRPDAMPPGKCPICGRESADVHDLSVEGILAFQYGTRRLRAGEICQGCACELREQDRVEVLSVSPEVRAIAVGATGTVVAILQGPPGEQGYLVEFSKVADRSMTKVALARHRLRYLGRSGQGGAEPIAPAGAAPPGRSV